MASSVYFSPTQQIAKEKAAEEQQIRQQHTVEMAQAERQARADFEADLKAKRASAKADFEAGLTAEKNKDTFEQDISAEEQRQRTTFEEELAAKKEAAKQQFQSEVQARKATFVGVAARRTKIEYAMQTGVQLSPKQYAAMKGSAAEVFASLSEPELQEMAAGLSDWEKEQRSGFESQLGSWKETEKARHGKQVSEWEATQEQTFESQLADWEVSAKSGFETKLTGWKAEETAKFEPEIQQWAAAWQPKGIAERLMDIKVPSLDIGGKLMEGLGVKPKPFRITPTGMIAPKGYKPEVAPFALPAGIIGSVESITYSVAGWAGVPTPRVPATLSGGLISSAIMSGMKGQFAESPEMKQIRAYGASGQIYAFGTVVGDILVSLGISKAVKAGSHLVKGVAGTIYEESGLKGSHGLYEAKEAWLGVKEKLPLWLTSPREAWHLTDTARSLESGVGDLKRTLLGVKYSTTGGQAIIGLPTLAEVPKSAAEEALVKGTLGMTREEVGWLPRLIAAEDIMGMAEARGTAAFGLTVPQLAETTGKVAKAGTSLAEALAETAWLTAPAAEKWGARAGFREFGTEEWLIQPPEDLSGKMIKGGKYFDINMADVTGFSKLPKGYRAEVAGKYFFEKQVGKKWRSLSDLLKSGKGEARLADLLLSPATVFESGLPQLITIGGAAAKVAPEIYLGAGAVLGVRAMPKAPTRVKETQLGKTLSSEILKPAVSVKAAQRTKLKAAQAVAQIPVETLDISFAPPSESVFTMPPAAPRRRTEETAKQFRKREAKQRALAAKLQRRIFPILPAKKIPAFLRMGLGKVRKSQNISASSYIFSKRKVKPVERRKAKK